MHDLPFTLAALRQAYRSGVTPGEVVDECFRRIEAVDDPGIFIHLIDRDTVRNSAEALEPFDPDRFPLWGIPFVIKDNIDAGGLPTTAACPEYAYTAAEDAFVVARLREAGAILVGKTNLDQFATGLVGTRSPYPVPRNAIDPEIVPGGSSSGSAIAVAHGLVCFSLGTDTAGSGRIPAGLNNIVGLKPTLGALSASGVVPACRTLDTVSVFALTVADAYRVFQVAAGFDSRDAYSKNLVIPEMGRFPPRVKVGIPSKDSREFFGDAAQSRSFDDTVRRLEDLGAEIAELDFRPFYEIAALLYAGAWVAERYSVIEDLLAGSPDAVHPVTRQIVGKGEGLSAADAFRDIYAFADLRRTVEPALASVDLLCVPTMPTFVSLKDIEADPIAPNNRLGTYTNFVNLLDLCGIAVPVAARPDGRPGSVTLLTKAGDDNLAAGIAARLHASAGVELGATGWPLPAETSDAQVLAPGEFAIAVAGAHMSGLPLNGALTGLGGRFVKASRTSANYRLYHLDGGPPERPGLVRDPSGTAIEIEVWALRSGQVGKFLKDIPAPLGIGTVTLESGETVNGFICEAAGLNGAQDITEYGGWRRFLASRQPETAA